MIQNAKQALAFALLMAALATLGWYGVGRSPNYRLDPHTLSTLPDHQITALELRQFNTEGQLIHHLTTPYMHHVPEHNEHWAKTPHLNAITQHQPNWIVRALEATAYLEHHQQYSIYRGNVALDHGNTHLRAYRATTQSDATNQLTLATALGNGVQQAQIWVNTTANKPPLHAFADRIRYEPQSKRIVLSGHARITQGKDSFTAPEIVYDLDRKQVITLPRTKQRTEIMIHSSLKRVVPHA